MTLPISRQYYQRSGYCMKQRLQKMHERTCSKALQAGGVLLAAGQRTRRRAREGPATGEGNVLRRRAQRETLPLVAPQHARGARGVGLARQIVLRGRQRGCRGRAHPRLGLIRCCRRLARRLGSGGGLGGAPLRPEHPAAGTRQLHQTASHSQVHPLISVTRLCKQKTQSLASKNRKAYIRKGTAARCRR